ncbi:MAG: FliM/FliN family flagellar motor switch protein [Sphingomonadales bacterium]|nr:FliM/FliN family flagellar motor switch protein [Sphingomonadales bacterium]
MNTHHSFVAERRAAQHCAELLNRLPDPALLMPALERAGERLARLLAPAFAALLGGDDPDVTVAAPAETDLTGLADMVGPLAASSLVSAGRPGLNLLASVDGEAMLRLVDRAFGGRGEAGGPLPRSFPLSAELMIQRVETLLAASLAEALGQAELGPVRRASSLTDLAPFAPDARLCVLQFALREGNQAPLKLLIALERQRLPDLLGQGEPAPRRAVAPADPATAPFADLPLPLTATLVDLRLPLATLATLEPGMVLPVAVARAVPLAIGSTVVARGTLGAQDDRIAIKLTQLAEGNARQ